MRSSRPADLWCRWIKGHLSEPVPRMFLHSGLTLRRPPKPNFQQWNGVGKRCFPDFLFQHHIKLRHERHRRQHGENYLSSSFVLDTDEAERGTWGPWSSASSCSRSCGGGVAQQIRQCFDVEWVLITSLLYNFFFKQIVSLYIYLYNIRYMLYPLYLTRDIIVDIIIKFFIDNIFAIRS